jgi:hypothetical protein
MIDRQTGTSRCSVARGFLAWSIPRGVERFSTPQTTVAVLLESEDGQGELITQEG